MYQTPTIERPMCKHCEKEEPANSLGLCKECYAKKSIRRLYIPRFGWTQEREERVKKYVERAKHNLSLFEEEHNDCFQEHKRVS